MVTDFGLALFRWILAFGFQVDRLGVKVLGFGACIVELSGS